MDMVLISGLGRSHLIISFLDLRGVSSQKVSCTVHFFPMTP